MHLKYTNAILIAGVFLLMFNCLKHMIDKKMLLKHAIRS